MRAKEGSTGQFYNDNSSMHSYTGSGRNSVSNAKFNITFEDFMEGFNETLLIDKIKIVAHGYCYEQYKNGGSCETQETIGCRHIHVQTNKC